MARRAVSTSITEEFIQQLVDSGVPGCPLPIIYFVNEGAEAVWRATAFVLKYRVGGFMVVLPIAEEVIEALQNLSPPDQEGDGEGGLALYKEDLVQCETPR